MCEALLLFDSPPNSSAVVGSLSPFPPLSPSKNRRRSPLWEARGGADMLLNA